MRIIPTLLPAMTHRRTAKCSYKRSDLVTFSVDRTCQIIRKVTGQGRCAAGIRGAAGGGDGPGTTPDRTRPARRRPTPRGRPARRARSRQRSCGWRTADPRPVNARRTSDVGEHGPRALAVWTRRTYAERTPRPSDQRRWPSPVRRAIGRLHSGEDKVSRSPQQSQSPGPAYVGLRHGQKRDIVA